MTVNARLPNALYTISRDTKTDLAVTIIEGLATLTGTSPLELDVRLSDVIDPDALEELFDPSPDDVGHLVFPLGDYLVSVHSNGEIAFHRT